VLEILGFFPNAMHRLTVLIEPLGASGEKMTLCGREVQSWVWKSYWVNFSEKDECRNFLDRWNEG